MVWCHCLNREGRDVGIDCSHCCLLYVVHRRTQQRVLLGKLAHCSTERQCATASGTGETLVRDLLCTAALRLPAPFSTYSAGALPACAKLHSGEPKRGLFLPPFFLLCFTAVLPYGCTCLTKAGLWIKAWRETKEAQWDQMSYLALLPLQLPPQWPKHLASTSPFTHEIRLTKSGKGATRGWKTRG